MLGTVEGSSSFGALLREFRIGAGLSQEALAERASMSADGIGALERGVNRAPQRETLALLVRALQLEPEQQRSLESAARKRSRPRRGTVASKTHNLPRLATPLFGRDRELEEIGDLVRRAPVVTLTGAGGVGKTRLAVETGRAVADSFADGIWFVDLAPARDGDGAIRAITEVFGVRGGREAPLDGVAEALANKSALVIFDNCEQVADSAAAAAEVLCKASGGVVILATSRQPLHVAGEQAFRVASLDTEASLALFASAATRADPSFRVDEFESAIVRRICERLDGIALAIELAAARVRFLSIAQIDEHLSERFAVLTGGGPVTRHQTMRALVDWSFDLLSENEKILLARLGVFPADFSLEAAMAVCAADPVDETHFIDLLGSLVDKSLVISERRGHVRRFRLLETMRAYALERLGDDLERLERRHAEYYLAFAEANDKLDTARTSQLEIENENFLRALDWAIDDGADAGLGIRLLAALQEYLLLRGLAAAMARRAERALASTGLSPVIEAKAWEIVAAMRGDLLHPAEALEASSRSRLLYEALGDTRGIARAARGQGIAHLRLGVFDEAERGLQEAVELSRAIGDERECIRALGSMGVLYEMTGRLKEARKAVTEVLAMSRARGDERLVSVSLVNLAEAEFGLGHVDAAIARAHEVLGSEAAGRKNLRMRAQAESNLAAYLIVSGRSCEARQMASAAAHEAREAGDRGLTSCALGHAAAIIAEHDPTTAARLLGYVDSVFAATGYRRENTETKTYLLLVAELEGKLDKGRIATLRNDGALMNEDQAFGLLRSSRSRRGNA
jgi:predicted ATPase